MKKPFLILVCGLSAMLGCSQNITDISGNEYSTITIGSQTWMAENLKATNYQNGDPMINLIETSDWLNSRKSGYCFYNNDSQNMKYGCIYKYNTISDRRGVCPIGWRIPSLKDIEILGNFLGGKEAAATKLKSTSGWTNNSQGESGNGNNISGFNAEPFGFRSSSGGFFGFGVSVSFWTSDMAPIFLSAEWKYYDTTGQAGWVGYYVRCIRDEKSKSDK